MQHWYGLQMQHVNDFSLEHAIEENAVLSVSRNVSIWKSSLGITIGQSK